MGITRMILIGFFGLMTAISFIAFLMNRKGMFWASVIFGFLTVTMFFSERVLQLTAKIPGAEFSTSLSNVKRDTITKNNTKDTASVITETKVRKELQLKPISPTQAIGNNSVSIGNIKKSPNAQVRVNSPDLNISTPSVSVNQPIEPAWSIGSSEHFDDTLWRAKLIARGRGSMAFYNWNILLTLNTPVIKREDVPGEVTTGPWMPLSISGGNLLPNQFFIGFSEFKPSESLAIYLYTKEPIKVQRVDVVPGRN